MDSFSKDPMLNSSPEESSLSESCKNPNSNSPKSSSNSKDECEPSVDALLKDILTDVIEDIEESQPKNDITSTTTVGEVFESAVEDQFLITSSISPLVLSPATKEDSPQNLTLDKENVSNKISSASADELSSRQSNDFIKAKVLPEILLDSKLNCSPTISLEPLSQEIVQHASRKRKSSFRGKGCYRSVNLKDLDCDLKFFRSVSLKDDKRKRAPRRSNSLTLAHTKTKSALQVTDQSFHIDLYESEMSPEPCDDFPVVEIKKKKTPIQEPPKKSKEFKKDPVEKSVTKENIKAEKKNKYSDIASDKPQKEQSKVKLEKPKHTSTSDMKDIEIQQDQFTLKLKQVQEAFKSAHQEKKKKMLNTILKLKDKQKIPLTNFKIPLKKPNDNSVNQIARDDSVPKKKTLNNEISKSSETKKHSKLQSTPKTTLESLRPTMHMTGSHLKHKSPTEMVGYGLKHMPTYNNTPGAYVKQRSPPEILGSNFNQIQSNNSPPRDSSKKTIIPKFKDVIEAKKKFHDIFNSPDPSENLSCMLDNYVKKISPLSNSSIILLLKDLTVRDSGPMSASNLSFEEKNELYGLMSRSVGIINFYQLYGIEYDLRQYKPNKRCEISGTDKNINNLLRGMPLRFDSRQEENEYWWNCQLNLTISELYIVYRHLQERFSSPFRMVKMFFDENALAYNMKITFENNWPVESTDSSIEACVKYVCHNTRNMNFLSKSLHQDICEYDPQSKDDTKLRRIEIAKTHIKDEKDLTRFYMKKFMERLSKREDFSMYDFFDEDGNIRYEMYGNNTLANYQQRQAESGFKLKEYKEPRFSNYLSMLRINSNTNRGHMKRAESIPLMSDREYNHKINRIQEESGVHLNLSQLFSEN